MMERNTSNDPQPYEIHADWESFTNEIQAVVAKKQQRLTRDKLLFYAWGGLLIAAIAVLYWLLIVQKREQVELVATETKKLEEQVVRSNERIETTGKDVSRSKALGSISTTM